jgi:hypothetical protein
VQSSEAAELVAAPSELTGFLEDVKNTTRDQLAAAWQLQEEALQERLTQLLSAGWRDHIDRVFHERFAELAGRVDREFRAALESRLHTEVSMARAETESAVRRDLSSRLNRIVRSLRAAANFDEWRTAVCDGCAEFAGRVALFSVQSGKVTLEAARGAEGTVEIALQHAPAFSAAVESADTVAALATASELSDVPAALFDDGSGSAKVYLFPVASRQGVVAVVCAGSLTGEIGVLELITSAASVALDARTPPPAPAELVTIGEPQPQARPAWSQLSKDEQELHLKAQRFARVQVASMRLYRAQQVQEGRAARNLYAALRPEIDAGRAEFCTQFLSASVLMVDYFHVELLRSLANDDPTLLGEEYPGPLV